MSAPAPPWDLWRRQVLAVARLEVRKNFLGRRAALIYLVAALPLFPLAMLWIGSLLYGLPSGLQELGASMAFAGLVYQGFILRFSLYLGCVWIFMNLFRGEVLDRSLHFYFLSPIRREVLVAGKFLSGWIASAVLFSGVTAISFVMVQLSFGAGSARQYLLNGPGLAHLVGYVMVTALGCLGYGAVFLLTGLFFKNPVVPAAVIWGWESINYLLPPALKKVSVIHYLVSLLPVRISDGPLAILVEPTPAWLAVPGLLLVSATALAVAGARIRSFEIQYGAD